jgi:hypothetical protein
VVLLGVVAVAVVGLMNEKPHASTIKATINAPAPPLNTKRCFLRFPLLLIDIVRLDNDYYLRDWSLFYATKLLIKLSDNYPKTGSKQYRILPE